MSSATDTPSSLPLRFDTTLGALLIGALACASLYGITLIQTVIYFQRYPKDTPYLKTMVVVLWALDTFDYYLTSHGIYWYTVTNFANPLAAARPAWSLFIHVAVTSISNFIVRSLFTRRVWKLSNGNILLTVAIVVISTADLTIGLLITAKAYPVKSLLGLRPLVPLFYANFASGVLADLHVAISLCYFLWKSKTGFRRTDSLIATLVIYTVNTGMITALDASAGLITYAVMPYNEIFVAFYLVLSKLYLNSYLASLNARDALRGALENDGILSVHLSNIEPSPRGTGITYQASLVGTEEGDKRIVRPLPVKVDTRVEWREINFRSRPNSTAYVEGTLLSPTTP
ncbi:hypothetical protein BD410DRAFT_377107 [Rickenella mellea]|uniref:DUF6534 domain-containing protein n=1 Tax=Rickenella mellea TaxID=50990 RepID=A0A4Y7PY24_9AGAM|nr:hypothetical protein BD410DRAFT_377107 [Rickenella mellea]